VHDVLHVCWMRANFTSSLPSKFPTALQKRQLRRDTFAIEPSLHSDDSDQCECVMLWTHDHVAATSDKFAFVSLCLFILRVTAE
jgi:hypothetical protein